MPKPYKRRIMRTFKINEISAVDNPAQAGARAVIMKRDEVIDHEKLVKIGEAALTTAVSNHSHLIEFQDFDNMPTASGTTTWQNDHTHPWIMLDDGSIIIGEASGHTHDIDALSKAAVEERHQTRLAKKKAAAEPSSPTGVTPMPNEDIAKKLETAEKTVKALILKIAAISAFTLAEHQHFAKLGEKDQDVFLALEKEDRAAELAKITDADPVVYKAADGTEFRKSDDPRLVSMAKQGDVDRAELTKARKESEDASFEKRATEDFPHLPGELVTKVALLRAIEKGEQITDAETLTAVHAILKACDKIIAKGFKTFGSLGQPEADGNAEQELDKLAKDYAKANKVTFAKAYTEVLSTEEGSKLYNESIGESEPAPAH